MGRNMLNSWMRKVWDGLYSDGTDLDEYASGRWKVKEQLHNFSMAIQRCPLDGIVVICRWGNASRRWEVEQQLYDFDVTISWCLSDGIVVTRGWVDTSGRWEVKEQPYDFSVASWWCQLDDNVVWSTDQRLNRCHYMQLFLRNYLPFDFSMSDHSINAPLMQHFGLNCMDLIVRKLE